MEFFGISGTEFVVILLVALLVLGPKSIAQFLHVFKNGVTKAKQFSARLREESRAENYVPSIDLSEFDVRGLDPRQIIRDAVQEEMQAWMKQANPMNQPGPSITTPTSESDRKITPPWKTENTSE
ncbi:sec-independent protein translocase protein TatB [Arcanobacterium pluranimalium]|uniref:twin-arginine translocase TatA/TatE family subunit n=1 Tax=Arcanobacterium pluranimalium TaxID=108028 RepID=UPI00195B14A5|nr:twin-arginine translocase TatA/TatE family subunit [Arcanobacterium pluranimalium]MBM7825569.1 sec-independent protein translocase protein TatB [Arcanobacterium pluranimalium]